MSNGKEQLSVESIRELLGEATPGEWPNWADEDLRRQCWMYFDIHKNRDAVVPLAIMQSDAKFIYQSKQIVEFLLKKVEELEELNRALLSSNDRDKQAWVISIKDLQLQLYEAQTRYQAAIEIARIYHVRSTFLSHNCAETACVERSIEDQFQRLKGKGYP